MQRVYTHEKYKFLLIWMRLACRSGDTQKLRVLKSKWDEVKKYWVSNFEQLQMNKNSNNETEREST